MSENDALNRIVAIKNLITLLVRKDDKEERKELAAKASKEIKALVSELANDYERFRHEIEKLQEELDKLKEE